MRYSFLGAGGLTLQCLALSEVSIVTLSKKTRLVTSDNSFEEACRNLDKRPLDQGFQAGFRSTDVEEEGFHRCTRLRAAHRLSHECSLLTSFADHLPLI